MHPRKVCSQSTINGDYLCLAPHPNHPELKSSQVSPLHSTEVLRHLDPYTVRTTKPTVLKGPRPACKPWLSDQHERAM